MCLYMCFWFSFVIDGWDGVIGCKMFLFCLVFIFGLCLGFFVGLRVCVFYAFMWVYLCVFGVLSGRLGFFFVLLGVLGVFCVLGVCFCILGVAKT